MIDYKELKSRHDEIVLNIKNRNMDVNLDEIINMQDCRSMRMKELETLRARRNEIASLMKTGLKPDERISLVNEGKQLKEKISISETEFDKIDKQYQSALCKIPNYTHPDVPVGKEENNSKVLKHCGKIPEFDFKVLDHVQLGEKLDLIDFDTAGKVSGPKFYYLKNEAVILQMALERYALDIVMKHGFTPFITPDIAKEEILEGIGFNPRGKESNIYTLTDEGTALVGTAEITLGGYNANRIFNAEALPFKYTGLSHCFRKEAGAAGQYSKGLYRVHQFSKLEMFVFCLPQQSEVFHNELLAIEEEIFGSLGLAYRVIDTCTGDLGAPAYRKFDIEAWMPGRGENGEYGEVTSTSNCTDYQARNLNIRYKTADGKIGFVHMLNGTAVAVSRAIVAILENFQQKDGSIVIPEKLVSYTGFSRINSR